MFEIFINYRKVDARYGAAATYELLARRFERERIFLDNQSMWPGAEYPAELRAALESMRVLVVLIGPRWLASRPTDDRLLLIGREGDWVRREIRRALERGVPIIPVLLDGVSIPDPMLLPRDIRRLVHHQTIAIRHNHLGHDVKALGDRLAELLPEGVRLQAGMGSRWSPTPRQLPAATRTFVGRAGPMTELDAVLCSDGAATSHAVPIVVVDGTAGVGKTCLVVSWARRVEHCFPDGTLFVDMGGYGPGVPLDPSLVLASFLRALGVSERRVPSGLDAQVGLYRSLLVGKRVLVVLDNAVDAEQVRPLLPGSASCRVLVTTRTVLTGLVVAEGAHRIVLDLFSEAEASDLVRTVVGAERVAAEPDAVAELVQLCSRLPLALRVATARVAGCSHLGITDLVHELSQALGRVDALSRTGDERTAVRNVFDWSLTALSPELDRFFRRIGVQPALEFGVHAAAALFGTDPVTAQRRLDELADVHLVEPIASRRYKVHALLHDYSAERADDDGFADERQDALTAVLDWYAATATAADRLVFPTHPALEVALEPVPVPPSFSDRAGAWAWLIEERATLLTVLHTAVDQGLHAVTIALSGAARFLALMPRAAWHDRLDSDTSGLAAAVAAGDRTAEAVFLRRRADTHQMLGDWAASDADLQRAAAQAVADGDDVLRGLALCGLGRNRKLQHKDVEAMTFYRVALPLVRGVGTGYVEAIVEANLSQLSARLGRHQDALRHAERELALHRGTGDTVGEAYALHDLARARQGLGDHAAATDLSERAAATFRATAGTDQYLVAALETMAESIAHLGDLSAAMKCLDEAISLLDDADPHGEVLRRRGARLCSLTSAHLPARLGESCARLETRSSAVGATRRTPRAR